jgi:alanine racemase
LKLAYSIDQLAAVFGSPTQGRTEQLIHEICHDTRKITHATGVLFIALAGKTRSGDTYLEDAYNKGVRFFLISESSRRPHWEDVCFWSVKNPLEALQALATFHRQQFNYPVIAITGSTGKTTFKEWAFHCFSTQFNIVRSPKSFNSQLGVALSLLELHKDANLALIEAGISELGEMHVLEAMIQPDWGILTAFGTAHRSGFKDETAHLAEKLQLFKSCSTVFAPDTLRYLIPEDIAHFVWCNEIQDTRFPKGYAGMIGILKELAVFLKCEPISFQKGFDSLPTLALRMEVFDGVNGNTIINDTYNLDPEAFKEALHYQQQLAGSKSRVVILGVGKIAETKLELLQSLAADFHVDSLKIIPKNEHIDWEEYHNAVLLIKASRDRGFESEIAKGKAIKHRTIVEVNLTAIQHNIQFYRSHLSSNVQLLAMVKAAAYGTGIERIAPFLAQNGMDYFGVAFADEGVELRKLGIQQPIVVMNPDMAYVDVIIEHRLEPAIFSFQQLDVFVRELILRQISNYPIHLKFDTGMHRLGFDPGSKEQVLAFVTAQPELSIAGIYSHLAAADKNELTEFTLQQISHFEQIVTYFRQHISRPFLAHLLNSEGAIRYPNHAFDMVRLGISMYGFTENISLQSEFLPSLKWYSSVSQIKQIPAGDFIGYGCSYQTKHALTIAIVPVGYADGFRRSLSNGVGAVFINGYRCPVVGRVCMDMIMVDLSDYPIKEGDAVEIIGEHQSMYDFAKAMNTIPYEVMTGLSARMHRVYISE